MAQGMALAALLLTVSIVHAVVDIDRVTTFPGTNTTEWGFDLYSGFLKLPYTGGKTTHYVFATSQNSTTDPVVLWLTGGPGCSSLSAFSYENGPFYFAYESTNLIKNEYSWNNYANMLWLESPPGVGFSSYGDRNNSATNDTQTTSDNLASLIQFFEDYPEYAENEFYISGESYAGIYVPDLANQINLYNNIPTAKLTINLKGFLAGNGVTDPKFQGETSYLDFLWWHALIGQETRDALTNICPYHPTDPSCQKAEQAVNENTVNINPYDIYLACTHTETTPDADFAAFSTRFRVQKGKYLSNPQNIEQLQEIVGFACVDVTGSTNYWNQKESRDAFHVESITRVWQTCYGSPYLNYTSTPGESIQHYPDLISSGIKILIYSGDVDSVVPTTGSRAWINNLVTEQNYTTTEEWRSWYYQGQVAGYTTEYNNNFRFLTVKGAGHMAIQWKRPQGYRMFNCFINGTSY